MSQTKTEENQHIILAHTVNYKLDHIAIEAHNISESVRWHKDNLNAECLHQDDTWALLKLADGSKIALVTKSQHPPHIGLKPSVEPFGDLKVHRDGSYSFYQKDPNSCAVYEWIWYPNQN